MTALAIPAAISSAVSSLTHHGHKNGVHGSNSSTSDSSSTDATSGTTQSLFGSLLDSAEQVIGIQTPSSTTTATNPATTLTASHASKLSPAAMISASRSALQKA